MTRRTSAIRPRSAAGGLLDIGCYTISLARFIFAAEPQRVFGIMERDPAMQVDRLGSGIMDFGRGTATFTYGTQLANYQRVNIFGTTGRIEIEIPFNAPPDRPCKMTGSRAATAPRRSPCRSATSTPSRPTCSPRRSCTIPPCRRR